MAWGWIGVGWVPALLFVLLAGLISRWLPTQMAPRTRPIVLGDLGE